MSPAEIVAFLSNTPLFRGLKSEALADIAGRASIQRYQPGEMVLWQGEPSTAVYLIRRGIATVTRLAPAGRQAGTLAHLMPGESFGEVGILENQPRSASVVALTSLDVLAFGRDDFLALLMRHSALAIAWARILGRYLVEADRRHAQGASPARLVLLFDLGAGAALAGLADLLATTLARDLGQPTIYAEHPALKRPAGVPGSGDGGCSTRHPAGYDIYLPHEDRALSAAVRATLLLDEIGGQYRNAIVALPGAIDASSMVFVEQATHVVPVVPPTEEGLARLERLRADLARHTASGRLGLSSVVVGGAATDRRLRALDQADYTLDALDPWPSPLDARSAVAPPAAAARVVEALIDRIDRTHQIAIYIPTTIAVDRAFDTAPYVARTLALLGERFGGATSSQAQGVWRSDMAGLVGEAVHIVHAYTTEADLNRYLNEVLAYVGAIKRELQQEAMALEIDQKLMLI